MNSRSRSPQSQPISNDDLEIDLNEENIELADQSPSYGDNKSDDSSPAEISKTKVFEPSIEIIQVKTEKSEKNVPRKIAEINVIYETHKEAKNKKFGNSFIEFEEIPEIKGKDLTFTLDQKQDKSNTNVNVICDLKTFDDRKKHVEEEERRSKSLKQKREEALLKMKKDKSIEKPQQEKKTFNEIYEELERKAKDEQNPPIKKRKLSQERIQVKSIEKSWMQEDVNRKHEKSLKNEKQNNLNLEQQENKIHHQNQEIVRFEKKSPIQQEKQYHSRDSQEILPYAKKQEKNKEVKYGQIENKRKVEQQKFLREDLEIAEKSDFSIYKNIVWHKSRFNEADICDICGNADPGDFDSIYICDLCHCTTHQSCYGGDLADRNAINDSSGIIYIFFFKYY